METQIYGQRIEKSKRTACYNFEKGSMELIEVILSKENLNRVYKKVVANKGASGSKQSDENHIWLVGKEVRSCGKNAKQTSHSMKEKASALKRGQVVRA